MAREALLKHSVTTPRGPVPDPLLQDKPAFEDVRTALSLVERLMVLCAENGLLAASKEHAESMADLAESAYGWDSQEAALCRKEVYLHQLCFKRIHFPYVYI